MTDNTILFEGQGGNRIRDIEKTNGGVSTHTQVVTLDAGGAGTESLVSTTNPLPVSGSGVASTDNSTTATLSGDATYTGIGEQNAHSDVMVSCFSDTAGTLYFDFSVNGTDWRTFPVAGFSVAANIHEFHTAVKGPRYFRIRFVNGASAQSTFQLYTYFGTFRQGNSPLNQSVGKDSDAITARVIGEERFTAEGRYSDRLLVHKFGENPDVDGAEDIWEGQTVHGDYTGFPTSGTAETIDVSSSLAADTNTSGTGAWTIRLYGLDANWEIQEETITMNGTNKVTSSGTYQRAFRIIVLTAGSGGTNAGVITAQHTTTTANVFCAVPAGEGRTRLALYTIPAGYTGYMVRIVTGKQ